MENKINFAPFSIDAKIFGDTAFYESVFFSGNGRMGSRGFLPIDDRALETGLFVAGIFGSLSDNITDFVNLPTPVCENIYIDEKKAVLDSSAYPEISLNFKNGEVTQKFIVKNGNKKAEITHKRFFSMYNLALLAQKTTYMPCSDMELKIQSGINTQCCNCPVPDDQTKSNTEHTQLTIVDDISGKNSSIICKMHTVGTNITVEQSINFICDKKETEQKFIHTESGFYCNFNYSLNAGESVTIEKNTQIKTGRDVFKSDKVIKNYGEEMQKSEEIWRERFETSDIEIEGADDDQCAIRYAIFELIANCAAHDSSVSIGARGLTHTRYKGCYFWDTDIFMLPFYINTNTTAAKNLVMYRAKTLPQAENHAKKMSSVGARYPWMASYSGDEQCESWDIGACEMHITCDVVYSIDRYIKLTGDNDFYINHAAEIYIKTARFWADRYTVKDDEVDLHFCKGPDEYCGITSNNLFTNMFVRRNLELAIKAAELLQNEHEEKAVAFEVTSGEINTWKNMSNNIKLPKDNNGRYLQDDTFSKLTDIDLSEIKKDDKATYHNVCFDKLQQYKVIKQADTLLLMTRMPEKFTKQEMINAWQDFEPLCLHDSTLSFASHAYMGSLVGEDKKAYEYLQKALFLDLNNIMGNTGKEGLHLANFGETYNAVVFGFLGLSLSNGEIKHNANLPKSWKKVKINFVCNGKKQAVEIVP